MSRNSSDDWSLTEGIVKKQKRFRYTPLEERKMWHFFAHELRGGNPKAKFGPAIWEQYKQFNKETTKSTYGLESHFRKIMIPNMLKYHAEMEKEDFFLLLRYFKIELNGEQLRRLERIFNCRLETDSAGCFMSACSLKPGDMSIFPTREERRTLCGFGDEDMEVYEEQSSIVDEEDEEQAVENIVIDEDEDGDGSGTTEDMQILKPDQRTQPIAAKIAKKVLETRIEPLRRSEASTSTGEWLGKPETMPRFQEIGIQCDNPCTIQLPLSNPNVTTRPVTRSQANKTSKSTSQLTTPTISKCTIVRTTNFCYPSLMSTRATKCVPTSRKLQVDEENSAVKTRAQKKVSRGLAKLVSPTFSLDSSNASSVILPANPFQFIQTTRLKKRLLANMCNVVDQGAGAVNQLMDGVPQKRKENLLLAQKQLEWILRDDFLRTSPLRSKRTVSI